MERSFIYLEMAPKGDQTQLLLDAEETFKGKFPSRSAIDSSQRAGEENPELAQNKEL